MDETKFWALVESVRGSDGDSEHALRMLNKLDRLDARSRKDVRGFFEKMLELSDDALLRQEITEVVGVCSNDCFLYLRAWLVSRGRQTFEKVMQDPSEVRRILPASDTRMIEFERFLYAATVEDARALMDGVSAGDPEASMELAGSDGRPSKATSVVVPGIGRVTVGTIVRHRELGDGTVKVIIPGLIVRAVIDFQGNESAYALMPEYFKSLE